MRILVIDNVDSFTWNLVSYVEDLTGTRPTVISNAEPGWDARRMSEFDAIIVSPGPGSPRVPADVGLSALAFTEVQVPTLGVCLGHQLLGHVFGAQVVRAPEPVHGQVHTITHTGAELFRGLPESLPVVRYHSLIASQVPPELEVTATTEDGLVMAMQHTRLPYWGVQFHPESIGGFDGHQLIANFLRLARRWRLHVHTVDLQVDAASVYEALFAKSEHAFWLDSSAPELPNGRYSYLGDASGPLARVRSGSEPGFFDWLERDLSAFDVDADVDFDFTLGWVGALGYGLKQECGSAGVDSAEPNYALIFADRAVVIDHLEHRVHLIALLGSEHDAQQVRWCAETAERLSGLSASAAGSIGELSDLRLEHSKADYLGLIAHCLEEIRAGNSYEVCLTNRLYATGRLHVDNAYRRLRDNNPTPFGALLKSGDLALLSSSPERFIRIDRFGRAESKPIKGTRPRSADPSVDAALKADLASHPKDRAENLMIVDLVRNDLTAFAQAGSVRVDKLWDVESYATVHQLVSTVSCQLAAGVSPVRLVRAAFPGGSMTGAPKIRTMEIIDRLEGVGRGLYSGAIGYFSLNGAVDLSMTIRTIVAQPDGITYGVGGAILALSDPEDEWAEIQTKSAPLLRLLGQEFPS
ncbi:aminodeoxychorismate synthase component I [Corynebacterium tapiri]|uniref:aminodeoxychorismate synthase n=1 Tax=Corynebacterium tapiri TaxID=1448266 RepID=A0A5C4U2Z6_9CORY|nr:aminodeoxychorismate synthase component I [Corynebacterium tapiri]TNL96046.1 aminodeoxychorismate synthase component I [Corynebacterium tapiri]